MKLSRWKLRLEHTMPMKRLIPLLCFTILAVAAGANPKSMVIWSVSIEPKDARAGEAAQIIATAKLQPGWHIYALDAKGPIPTSFVVHSNALKQQGKPIQPAPRLVEEPTFGKVGE